MKLPDGLKGATQPLGVPFIQTMIFHRDARQVFHVGLWILAQTPLLLNQMVPRCQNFSSPILWPISDVPYTGSCVRLPALTQKNELTMERGT